MRLHILQRGVVRCLTCVLLPSFLAIFRAHGSVASVTTLASFFGSAASGTNGHAPYSGLVQTVDGNFYGTTFQGGSNTSPAAPFGFGTVYKLTPAGTVTTFASFNGTNGAKPYAGLTQGLDGNLYGVTWAGGESNRGCFFRLSTSTNGSLTKLLTFTNANGANPSGKLTLGHDGFLYGTTQQGGSSNLGTVFKTTTNGVLTTLVSFQGNNGSNPYAEVIQGSDGFLYGVTVNGGLDNFGTVFKLTTNGIFTLLASFNGSNGYYPYGGLTQDTNGALYGTTAYGGDNDAGTVFRISTNGTLVTLHSFSGNADGSNPWATLLRGRDGSFYGTTILGGETFGIPRGTVFQILTNGAFASLASFGFNTNGGSPYSSLLQDSSGRLYGTTLSLGVGLKGTIFRLEPAPAVLSASMLSGSMQINWKAWLGQTYQLQFETNLTQNGWIDFANSVTATNSNMTVTNLISGQSRQYRLKQTSTP